jgi:hypothetical protein
LTAGCPLCASIILILCTASLASLPEARAGCGNSARPDPRRGSWATMIPTPTTPNEHNISQCSILSRPMMSRSNHQVRIVAAHTEGCSIRSTERLLGVHRGSIMRLSARSAGCVRLRDRLMRDLPVNLIELDGQMGLHRQEAAPRNTGRRSRWDWRRVLVDGARSDAKGSTVLRSRERSAENTEAASNECQAGRLITSTSVGALDVNERVF